MGFGFASSVSKANHDVSFPTEMGATGAGGMDGVGCDADVGEAANCAKKSVIVSSCAGLTVHIPCSLKTPRKDTCFVDGVGSASKSPMSGNAVG